MNAFQHACWSAAVVLCAVWGDASAAADETELGDEFAQQDFLFQLEEAYTQDAGEWQIGAGYARTFGPGTSVFQFELEYGLTDRLQVSAEIPVLNSAGSSGVGDLEFSLDYAILKDNGRNIPELTLGAGFSAPTGNAEAGEGAGGWGYEFSLRASKQVAQNVYGHVMGSYERVRNGGSERDLLSEWGFGIGAAWRSHSFLTLVAEYLRERERETEFMVIEREIESYVSLGAVFEVADDVLIGVAGAAGLGDDSADAQFLAKLQIEW